MSFQLDPIALGRALTALDHPAPIAIRALGFPRSVATYGLSFAPGSPFSQLLLKVTVADPGHDPLFTELAALRLVGALGELPVPEVIRHLPASVLGRPAILQTALPGVGGEELLQLGQESAHNACLGAGQALRLLGQVPHPTFATRATSDGHFLPRRSTWREEFAAILAGHAGRASAWGTDLGATSAALVDRIWGDLEALDSARSWGLVHGDLHPGNVLLSHPERVELAGLVDWEGAMVGDPLVDWGVILHLPGPVLSAMVEGYGREAAAALLEEGGDRRLEIYWQAHGLRLLANAGLPTLGVSGGRPRALALELARQALGRIAAQRAADRLEAAIRGPVAGPISRRVRPGADLLLSRRLLESLRWGDRFGQIEAARVVGALGSVGAARLAPRGHAAGWIGLADRLVPSVPGEEPPPPAPPILDRAAWYGALLAVLQANPQVEDIGLALGFLAGSLEAATLVEGEVTDGVMRGVESVLHGLLREAELRPPAEPDRQLAHAWLGAWALDRLPALGGVEALRGRLAERAAAAWEDLSLGGERPDPWGSAQAALAGWPAQEVSPRSESALLLPALLRAWAEGCLPPGIDASPGAVLAVIGLTAGQGR